MKVENTREGADLWPNPRGWTWAHTWCPLAKGTTVLRMMVQLTTSGMYRGQWLLTGSQPSGSKVCEAGTWGWQEMSTSYNWGVHIYEGGMHRTETPRKYLMAFWSSLLSHQVYIWEAGLFTESKSLKKYPLKGTGLSSSYTDDTLPTTVWTGSGIGQDWGQWQGHSQIQL